MSTATKKQKTTECKVQEVHNWIDGKRVAASSGDFLDVENPSTGAVITRVNVSNAADVEAAVASSARAFASWSALTVKSRVQFLIRLNLLMKDNADELADLIVLEHGKNKAEALGDVAKGNETIEYAISMPQLITGNFLEVSRGVTCRDQRNPLGVVASIVPFNFPAMVPLWTLPIAIACGNTMIMKPSEKVPLTFTRMAELIKEAGVPDGVVNVIHGTREAVEAIIDHPTVRAVTFVGSTKVADIVSKRAHALGKKVLALGGAKNHLVSLPDANMELTANDVVNSFSGCTGQRCMASSVLLTLGKQDKLVERIVQIAGERTAGSGAREIGPVIDKFSQQRILRYIDEAEAAGAKILLDGRTWAKTHSAGYWVGPTVILHSNKDDAAMKDEIFGPVLSVFQVESKDEAIAIENSNPYGNAACVYTSTGENAEWFCARFSAGMLGVNVGVPVPREPFSFGGINDSKFAEHDITGDGGMSFFTKRIKVTTKWVAPPEKNWMS